MIPVRIKLKNFRAYEDEEMSLKDINLAVVSGPNGAGKSTFFTDAIRYAFFGSSPTGRIEELVRTGSPDMSVEYEFEHTNQMYRVIRSYTVKGRGKSLLELHVKDGDGWNPITGDKITDTEKNIVELLKINEETFISSSIVLQGRSNEFTAKGPTERKKVFTQTLGLEVYDKLQQAAKDKIKATSFELEGVSAELTDISGKLAVRPQTISVIDGIKENIATTKNEIDRYEKDIPLIEESIRKLQNQLDSGKQNETEIAELNNQISGINEQITQFKARLDRANKVVENKTNILAKVDELDKVKTEVADLDKKQTEWQQLKDKVSTAELELAKIKSDLQQQESQRKAEIQTAENDVNDASKKVELAKLNHKQLIVSTQSEIDKAEQNKKNSLVLKNSVLDGLKKKAELLKEVGCERGDCKFLKDAVEARDQIPEIEEEIRLLIESDPAAELREKLALQQQIEPTEVENKALEQAQTLLDEIKNKHLQEPADDTVLQPFINRLDNAKEELANLNYDEQLHITQKERIPKLEQWVALKTELSVAEEAVKNTQPQIDALNSQIDEKKLKISDLQLTLLTLDGVAKELETKRQELTIAKGELKKLNDQLIEKNQELGRYNNILDNLQELETKQTPLQEKSQDLAEKLTTYETLEKAFSKNGIPALIIENAIPELERIANDTLSLMSNGSMNMSFVTQKENKSNKNISETLDIVVRGCDGERSYETFSGGEKFRIDFSIRLALGELLTRRAGAKIEFLIVDEPDGLDSDGMDLFAEVLEIMSERFKKIIAISHQEQLKNAFPARIEVYRDTDNKSHCRIVA